MLWNRRSIVGIRQTLGLVREQRAELEVVEAGEREVEAGKLQLAEFEPKQPSTRARPRARRETGEVLALLPAFRPAPGRAPPRAIDYSYV